jgi:hypothetical protein
LILVVGWEETAYHKYYLSVEVRDSLLLLLVVGVCVRPVYAVIVGVYGGAGVYMVPL